MAIPLAITSVLGSGDGGILAPLSKLAGSLIGGTRTQVNTSTTSNLSASVNPAIVVSVGDGQISPISGGSSTASGTSPINASQDDGLPSSFFGPSPLGGVPSSGRIDLSAAGPGDGFLAGLFNDPVMLMLVAGGAFLLFTSTAKG